MRIGTPKERSSGENRVAMTPDSASHLAKLGYQCVVETGAGTGANFADQDFAGVGVEIASGRRDLWGTCDVICKVRPPDREEIQLARPDQTVISLFFPVQNSSELELLAAKGVTVIAMDMVPRISRAQKMDVLSSMANIAGYRAVIEASAHFPRFFTGQITAAGKVPPARVLVIGAGVAGLAAIGTATSLGAVVRAFDVRPEVAEQIESMGAEFLFLDFDESGSGEGGYAKPSSPEFREKQLELFRSQAPEIDIVITTALIPGRAAPRLWLEDMVLSMKPGSVVVDLAAEQGGNCDLTVPDQSIVSANGVTVIGYTDFPSRMATQSSNLFATNVRHMLTDLTPERDGAIFHDMDDDVIRGSTVSKDGQITYPPPPPKVQAIAKPPAAPAEPTDEEKRKQEVAAFRKTTRNQVGMLLGGTLALLAVGTIAPPSLMQHLVVFVLACFVGFNVIWGVSHSLHTPLMSVTNAISGIIVLGALLQIGSAGNLIAILAAISVFIATINIVGGFLVTHRMLAMFQKS